MRRAVVAVAAAIVLAGPTVLAFLSGGYFAEPRLIAAIVAWALLLALALAGPAPLPCGVPGRLAVGGLTLLAAWSALSIAWAPLGGPAVESVQRLVLYLGAFTVAIAVLRTRAAMRAIEPALAGGAAIVIGYGLSGRLLPGIAELERSRSAGGRLEQPITYWNAEGALAAVGLILCARLAGDRTRPPAIRIAAAGVAPALGAGVYLSYSRGAIAVALLGLAILVAAAPSGTQLRACALALAAAAAGAAAAAAFPGVAALEGTALERDGAAALALMSAISAAAALAWARAVAREGQVTQREEDTRFEPPAREREARPAEPAAREREARPAEPAAAEPAAREREARPAEPAAAERDDWLPYARRLPAAVTALAAAVAIGLVVAGLAERPSESELAAGAGAGRLATVSSNRYEYWRVGLEAARDHPIQGLGAGGFRVEWLHERPIPEAVRDIHSLELEIATELGLVGLLAFGLMLGGIAAAARTALRRDPALAAGWCAAAVAWLLHASIDWDWQLPAVTLPAIVLAGALVALAEPPLSAR